MVERKIVSNNARSVGHTIEGPHTLNINLIFFAFATIYSSVVICLTETLTIFLTDFIVEITPTQTIATPTATIIVTDPPMPAIPSQNTLTFGIIIVIEFDFVSALQNRESEEFRSLRRTFLLFLIPLYQDEPGFIGIVINSFTPGSVVADMNLVFNSTEASPSVQDIEKPLNDARDNGSAPFTIQSFNVSVRNDSDDDGIINQIDFHIFSFIFFNHFYNGRKKKYYPIALSVRGPHYRRSTHT